MEHEYTIGQLAKLAGISTKTLRVYENKGLLKPERNSENGYRLYGEDAVKTLEKIQLMKYLDFSLDQILTFLKLYENFSRENMLLEQKRLLQKKREQLDSVIARVDRAVGECRREEQDSEAFLKSLSIIVKNQRADELVMKLQRHADEPRGWSRFVYEKAEIEQGMDILDAGAGYGNLWRYNKERIPGDAHIICVDMHNTHMDTFQKDICEDEGLKELTRKDITFIWDNLETMQYKETYDRIFFNHVAAHIEDRKGLYLKFAGVLKPEGKFICTWGGLLFYENLKSLIKDFLTEEEFKHFSTGLEEHKKFNDSLENELREAFSDVRRHAYVVELHFDTAEAFTDYIQQVCKPLREKLEIKRYEFLKYLDRYKNEYGQFSFKRDTYMYCCRKEGRTNEGR